MAQAARPPSESSPLLDGGALLLPRSAYQTVAPSDSMSTVSYPDDEREAGTSWLSWRYLQTAASVYPVLLPTLWRFTLFTLFYALLWLTWHELQKSWGMPSSVEPETSLDTFSGERAWAHVKNMCSKPHMYNSKENLRVRKYILDQLHIIKKQATNRTMIEILENDPVNLFDRNAFFESSNVVVRVRDRFDRHSNETGALLVSSHFDSTPLSHGVTDAGIAIGCMLETVRLLAISEPPFNPIIFNFNNGEEMGLYGGYAFLLHPWFKKIRGFINLEGTGAAPGTRSILFRTNSYEMTNLMSYAPFPHASILFNDLIKYVKSDTDYRPYSTYGQLPGVDIAFYTFRYLYHTPRDDINHSHPISAQHMGSNLLTMIQRATNSSVVSILTPIENVQDPMGNLPTPNFVFYDLYGRYLVLNYGWTNIAWQLFLIVVIISIGLLALFNGVTELNYIKIKQAWDRTARPFLRGYLVIALSCVVSLLFVLNLAVLKWLINPASTYGFPILNAVWVGLSVLEGFLLGLWSWPKLEHYYHIHTSSEDYMSLPGSPRSSREDVLSQNTLRVSTVTWHSEKLQLNQALFGHWFSLLVVTFLLSTIANWKGFYVVFNWSFSALIAWVLVYSIRFGLSRWSLSSPTTTEELTLGQSVAIWFKANLEDNMWFVGFLCSSFVPAIMTLDIFGAFIQSFPALIAEGLSSILVDMLFALFFILLLLNTLPALDECSKPWSGAVIAIVLLPIYLTALVIQPFSALSPQKLVFNQTWDLNTNTSSLELMITPTMSGAEFASKFRIWFPEVSRPFCRGHADKRDSTACVYAVENPIFKVLNDSKGLNSSDVDGLIQLKVQSKSLSSLEGYILGSPYSRICSFNLQTISQKNDSLQFELEAQRASDWSDLERNRGNVTAELNSPALILRRSYEKKNRLYTQFRILGNLTDIQDLTVTCFHSELETDIVESPIFGRLQKALPNWVIFHHGRYGGISLQRKFSLNSDN